MPRTLRHIAAEINADPSLGLKAEVTKSWANTDRQKPAGMRYRTHTGRGRDGLKLVVTLVRTGMAVCEVNTAERYENARDADEWLAAWRRFDRQYWRAPSPHFNDRHVEGELHPKRGHRMRRDQLDKVPVGGLVWLRVTEHGEDYPRMNGALPLERKLDCNEGRIMHVGHPMPVTWYFPGIDFTSTDTDMPVGDDLLDWDDGENRIEFFHVRLVPYVYKTP